VTAASQEQRFFHLTGRRSGTALGSVDGLALRPALFAGFHDLTGLRYDYPVVLVEREGGGPFVHTLSGLIDDVLTEIAPAGASGERLRRTVRRLEREIRVLLAGGVAPGRLSALWREAAERLIALGGAPVEQDLARARAALRADGELADCDAALPARFVAHAWRVAQERRARRLRRTIDTLVVQLSDLVRADHLRSESGRHADTLRSGVGASHAGLFDFDVMAKLLAGPSGKSALSAERRRRIDGVLEALRGQRFVGGEAAYGYEFGAIDAALAAFRERLPAMAELVKAIAVAELEVAGHYAEPKHDDYFRDYDRRSLGAAELALFPGYLVCLDARQGGGPGRARLLEALSEGVPLKVLVETDDILDESTFSEGTFSLGTQLARSAMGLNDVFVLQSASSNLYRVRERVLAAMEYSGPALLSVFSGAGDGPRGLPPYLVAAAAMQSRAFPAFSYDPAAGADWAQRFSLEENPQPALTWPVHELSYADGELQRATERLPFTFVDFVACDPRHTAHFARVPREHWNGGMVLVGDLLAGSTGDGDTVPCVYAVDADRRLHKLVVDEKLVQAARRCADTWRRLQELEGLKRKPEPVAATLAPLTTPSASPVAAGAGAAPTGAVTAVAGAPAAEAPVAEPSSDEPYIETPRCTSCNECTLANNRMFAYNENKQAYVKDPSAGTFRQLVEAAESCQVAIIHPGKPRDPNESGLDELLKRAEAFA